MPHSVHPTPRETTPDPKDLSTRYWNANRPKDRWTEECPEFLRGQSEKNIGILSRKDEDFERFTWAQVQDLVRTNRIHHFQRCSSHLRAYLEYTYQLKTRYGSVSSYIQHERLHWENITPSGDRPFSNPADFKILYNDWPYFLDEDIKHLVVWTKFLIDEDEATGDVAEGAKAEIEDFVTKTFCSRETGPGGKVDRNQIMWFKNWRSLKSVHALEHFHIMLYKAPEELLESVTGGDRPRSESWTGADP
ncbi:uncharacterized protein Z518_02524 [Rhinocladiella mackenziei CBS 650.93]|uniref:N-acetylglucosamine-induced protein 1 n=1 Tax=Rhinocladiella mackenziei CBS 650.93 TaxID=1442369 RepID=A0A0D2JF73_9EURO|nr:uncharacterized protein Z518_02524 [Rhinocladiella mackenziei CBS 650.93]KIX07870.1 hypothetical protein Z518_02524 [Rhinocladiella mackenziei CBS 650.93]